jgi:hypothetical protein
VLPAPPIGVVPPPAPPPPDPPLNPAALAFPQVPPPPPPVDLSSVKPDPLITESPPRPAPEFSLGINGEPPPTVTVKLVAAGSNVEVNVLNPPAPPPPHQSDPPPPPPATNKISEDIPADGVTAEVAALAKEVPFELVAVAVNVYAVPFVSPVTTIGDDAPVAVMFPGLEVIVYVADAPPVAPGVNVTEACAFPPVATPIVGACGTVVAVTELLAELAEVVLAPFDAVTVYVYPVDDCSPVTTIGLDEPVAVNDPGLDVTVKLEANPPVSVIGVNATDADPLLYARFVPTFVATTEVGVEGATIPCKAYHPPF